MLTRIIGSRHTRNAGAAVGAVILALGLCVSLGSAQVRSVAQERRVEMMSNVVLDLIRGSSCSEFMGMMQKSKSGGGRKSGAMTRLLQDPANRTEFANKIGGPLVNKLLDCKMMPLGR